MANGSPLRRSNSSGCGFDHGGEFEVSGVKAEGDGGAVFFAESAGGCEDDELLSHEFGRVPTHSGVLGHAEVVAAGAVCEEVGGEWEDAGAGPSARVRISRSSGGCSVPRTSSRGEFGGLVAAVIGRHRQGSRRLFRWRFWRYFGVIADEVSVLDLRLYNLVGESIEDVVSVSLVWIYSLCEGVDLY